MKTKWGVLAVVLSVLAVTSAYAHESNGGWMGAHGHSGFGGYSHDSSLAGDLFHKAGFFMKKQEALGLSEDQVKTIKGLSLDAQKSLIKSKADIEVIDLDIRAKLHEDKIDAAAVQKLIDDKYEAKKAMDKGMVDELAKLKAVLNDKQAQTLKDMKKDMYKKWADKNKSEAAGTEQR